MNGLSEPEMEPETLQIRLDAVGERLDRVLTHELPQLSRTMIQRLIKTGQILIDGRTVKPNLRLSGGELAAVTLPKTVESEIIPDAIPLDIRYEDEDMIVVNKPAGMVVHPGTGHWRGTLVNAILHHCPEILGVGYERRPGIVHRLDKLTSGLIVVAKNDISLRHLQAQFKERTVGKMYLALVDGHVDPAEALIDAPIGRDPQQRKRMAVIPPGRSIPSRTAQTQYKALSWYEQHTLLECRLFTGRTHQIRVHLAYMGYPVAGDSVYGRRKKTVPLQRHFLHAAELRLMRPADNVPLELFAELPPELQIILDELKLD